MSCPVGRAEEFSHASTYVPWTLQTFLCKAHACFLASKFHVCISKICTTSELLVRLSFRTSTTLLYNSKVGPFFSSSSTNRSATRDSRNFLVIVFPMFDCLLCLIVIQRSNILATTPEFCSVFGWPQAFSVCGNAHLLPSLQFPLLMKRPLFKKRSVLPWFPCLKTPFPVSVTLSKKFQRGELRGRQPFSFPLDSHLFSGSSCTPHLSARALICYCPLYAISTVSFPLSLHLLFAAAALQAGFSSSLPREKECLSRIICFHVADHHLFSQV